MALFLEKGLRTRQSAKTRRFDLYAFFFFYLNPNLCHLIFSEMQRESEKNIYNLILAF